MRIAFASFSNVGPRSTNQDRVLAPFNDEGDDFVAAIADGIGGTPGGAEAAEIAIHLASMSGRNPVDLTSVFSGTVSKLREQAERQPEFAKMGTTLSIALIRGYAVHVAHVGDTRIYHLRGAGVNTLTMDQTEVAELRRKGILSESQAKNYARRNVLLSALSPAGEYEVFRKEARLKVGDRLLLMTDGVHQRVKRGAILNASLEHNDVAAFVAALEKRTATSEPSDNFSALAIQIVE
jgi:serine/threonine protein phosphatase PrpC